MTDQLENNKKNAIAFYGLMFNQNKLEEGIKKYVGDEYIQHNPEVGDGKASFIEYFRKMAIEKEGGGPPEDFKAYKQAAAAWAKSVGWR